MFGIDDAISNVSVLIKAGIERIWPDPSEQIKAQVSELQKLIDLEMAKLDAQAKIIVSESEGSSWLQRSWRPITMLTFLFLVVGHFFGLEGPNFTPDDSMHLFSLIELGLGGYVIGRSVEKIAPSIADAMRKK